MLKITNSYDETCPLPSERQEMLDDMFNDIPTEFRKDFMRNDAKLLVNKGISLVSSKQFKEPAGLLPIGINSWVAVGFYHTSFAGYKAQVRVSEQAQFAKAWQCQLARSTNQEAFQNINGRFLQVVDVDPSLKSAAQAILTSEQLLNWKKTLPEKFDGPQINTGIIERKTEDIKTMVEDYAKEEEFEGCKDGFLAEVFFLRETKKEQKSSNSAESDKIQQNSAESTETTNHKTPAKETGAPSGPPVSQEWRRALITLHFEKETIPVGHLTETHLLVAYYFAENKVRLELYELSSQKRINRWTSTKLKGTLQCFWDGNMAFVRDHKTIQCFDVDKVYSHSFENEIITSMGFQKPDILLIGTFQGHLYKLSAESGICSVEQLPDPNPILAIHSSGEKVLVQTINDIILTDCPKISPDFIRVRHVMRPVASNVIGSRLITLTKYGFIKIISINPFFKQPVVFEPPKDRKCQENSVLGWYNGVWAGLDGGKMGFFFPDGVITRLNCLAQPDNLDDLQNSAESSQNSVE